MSITTQQLTFTIQNETLVGTLYFPESKDSKLPSILIYHGRGSSKKRYTDRAEALAQAGFLAFVFDFRGCGESDGAFENQTIKMGYEDALAGYDFLLSLPQVDESRIGIFGNSFGGYQAALVSRERAVHSLVLAAPALYKDAWWHESPKTLNETEMSRFWNTEDINDNNAAKAISQYAGSLLVIAHEKDETIPRRITDMYFSTATEFKEKELYTLKNAPHPLFDPDLRTESNKITVEWFEKTL